jgi:hypothetical protein
MKFIVQGADRETGEHMTVTVDTTDAATAGLRANKMGLMVTTIKPATEAVAATAPSSPLLSPPEDGKSIICANPNCGFQGVAQKKARGSIVILVFLLLIGALPGILYLLFAGGYDHICPKCGMKQPGNLIALGQRR